MAQFFFCFKRKMGNVISIYLPLKRLGAVQKVVQLI